MEISKLIHDEDIKLICQFENEYFDSSLGYDFIKNEINNNPYSNYLVMKDNNELVGYIASTIDEYSEILNFFIVEKYRGKGYAKLLLKEVINAAKEINSKSISLEVKETNIQAIKLYEKFGFEKNRIRKGYYNGIDAVVMIKEME